MSNQDLLLENIEAFISGNGYSPTLRELAELIGKSKATVQRELDLMRANKLVDWKDGQSRTLHLTDKDKG